MAGPKVHFEIYQGISKNAISPWVDLRRTKADGSDSSLRSHTGLISTDLRWCDSHLIMYWAPHNGLTKIKLC